MKGIRISRRLIGIGLAVIALCVGVSDKKEDIDEE